VIPLLLGSDDPASDDILALVAKYCNAKEIVMAVQESFGILRMELGADDDVNVDIVSRKCLRLLRLYIAG
jgi:hypothetical protein